MGPQQEYPRSDYDDYFDHDETLDHEAEEVEEAEELEESGTVEGGHEEGEGKAEPMEDRGASHKLLSDL